MRGREAVRWLFDRGARAALHRGISACGDAVARLSRIVALSVRWFASILLYLPEDGKTTLGGWGGRHIRLLR